MSNSEVWTVKRLLDWTTDFLQQHGSDSPRLDAEVLLAQAQGCQRIQLYTAYDQVPPEENLAKFRQWIKQRAAGTPVAYLVGHREFYSLSFQVNPSVLIPRPETELLVTLSVDLLAESSADPPRVCDVGTGSGCIAIAIAKNHPTCQVTAVEISAEARRVAEQNVQAHQVADRVRVVAGDLLENIDGPDRFDLIVSNPPYVARGDSQHLAPNVRDHEPELALYGGADGTDVISRLVDQAGERLVPGGTLLFETSPLIMDRCVEIVKRSPLLGNVQVHRDLSHKPRAISAHRCPAPDPVGSRDN